MNYSIKQIASIVNGTLLKTHNDTEKIDQIYFDSRRILRGTKAIFIAFKTESNDGHKYLIDAYDKGIRNFLISENIDLSSLNFSQVIKVDNTLESLQLWAKHHRQSFENPVIAITGSNGKTIIKEWLAQALSKNHSVAKSPSSYNSQIGVALSILNINPEDDFAVIEAGISTMGEMEKLRSMIQPTLGIISNIGDAHSHGFQSITHKVREKLILFKSIEKIIYCIDHTQISEQVLQKEKTISWGNKTEADLRITNKTLDGKNTIVDISQAKNTLQFSIPFVNQYLIENCLHVIACLIDLGWSTEDIQSALNNFSAIDNRLEIIEGKNDCLLINDSYSADLASLKLALEYQNQHRQDKEKAIILTDFRQQKENTATQEKIKKLIIDQGVKKLIYLGEDTRIFENINSIHTACFGSTIECLNNFDFSSWADCCILIKGARDFELEKVIEHLSDKVHQTVLETNYSAIQSNLKFYKSLLKPETKVMSILKAEAYGTGSIQLAHFLSDQGIDYFAVALIDEAIAMRQAGITTPVMILNVQDTNLEVLWEYDLEPEIYSMKLLYRVISTASSLDREIKIHIKLDTGMNRLGFAEHEIDELITKLRSTNKVIIQSIFSHLSSSEDASQDVFTQSQLDRYEKATQKIRAAFSNTNPLRHILNTSGVVRHPQAQYDMVRIGLGLYGIDSTNSIDDKLTKAHTLKARILQIREIKKGERTGYGTDGLVDKNLKIAVISLGYADGLMRMAGKSNAQFLLNGQLCETIGNICMDVCMIDITQVKEAQEGDIVVIFGEDMSIQKLAESCQTIPYEIISRIAPRVKRTYHHN